MDAATIKEMNKTRVAAGMQPLPVPGESGPQFKEKTAPDDDGEEPASTLDTREAAAEDNYRKVREAEEAKKRREEKNAAIKKARDAAQRLALLQGKGLGEAGDEGDMDAKAWLTSQKKRQKQIEKARKYEAEQAAAEAEEAAKREYTSKDLAGVKVTHEISAFEDGDEQILTLKDSNIIGDDDEGDELENLELRDREKLQEKLDLKKRKPVYDPHAINEDGESSILAQYDEEISGKKTKKFVLGEQNTRRAQLDNSAGVPQDRKLEKINLDLFKDEQPSSDYLDISEIKVKKPKKKKSKSTRQRPADDDDILLPDTTVLDTSMDVDSGAGFVSKKRKTEDTSFADDEDLQATLAIQRRDALKKRKRTRPEDIARQLKQESEAPESEADASAGPEGGLVIDEISEFVSGLNKEDLEDRKPRTSKTPNREVITAMEDESDEDERMRDADEIDHEARHRENSTPAEIGATGVEEEKAIGVGIGSALQLLRERKVLKDTNAEELNESFRRRQQFLAEKRKREAAVDQQARDARERDRASGKLDRMSAREREDWQRRQNEIRDQQTSRQMAELFNRDYKPNVQLKYVDEHGRSLDQKDAFRQLSHQFHGKGSSKGKLDKQLKKIEDEKRREAQSILDSSQNANMSSATAQQTKKRREAGVRLA